ncbi:YtpR family tRNA-binding protein [Malacoplasma iowae]|uniref:YtpR family tRNA-binding protein n=1 Tax=Malacoplasma iowae TaxID=2116 RepID=UPI002A18959A|nr:tRNA-binding protein [Malacoplasma iowae]WPL36464.1 hypothetical protein QX179_03455 [Malacoplasma iowae]WPL38372.1 hypothetical protein QX182_02560 [Malacoplasma iowae]WPL41083.1 hypothetical protein QX184_00550 [Malacoplasma iowae]
MINIFYNKKNLKDTMVISIKNLKPTEIETNDDYSILRNNNEIVGINLFNVSKKNKINEGYLKFDDEIKNLILKTTKLDLSKYYEPQFVVGKVIECTPIQSTHLHLCKVDTKKEILQIVCGAKNVKQDLFVVVAKENTCMPSGMTIIKNKLQGHESCGMLCSEKELQNNPNIESKGILIIDESKNPWGSEYTNHFSNI